MPRTLTAALVALAAVVLAPPALAQIAGDGSALPARQETRTSSGLENYKYLVFGLASPSGDYGSVPASPTSTTTPYASGRGAASGYFVELGGNRFVYQPASALPIGVGIGWGLSFSMFSVDWQGLYGFDESAVVEKEGIEGVLDFRLGPTVSLQAVPGLLVGASFKLGPGASMLQGADIYDGFGDGVSDTFSEVPVAFGLRTSFGLDARFGALAAGLEFHRGSATYERDISNGSFFDTYSAEVGMNATRLYVGLNF